MKELILIRGLPGAGKTTIAKLLAHGGDAHKHRTKEISTDDFWEERDKEFNSEDLGRAHRWTERQVKFAMDEGMGLNNPPYNVIIVHNTFTQPWEWEAYEELAEEYGYRVHTIICEKRHRGESTSDVPQKVVDRMESRFQIRLQ